MEEAMNANSNEREGFVQDYISRMRVRVEEGAGDEEMEDQPANIVEAAQGVVAEATGGQVQMATAGGSQQGGGAPNGIYMFVNPQMGGGEVSRVARARSRGAGGRSSVSWAGMEGGGAAGPVAELTATSDVPAGSEITVMKEGQ
jgi:hypothetical protein